jgi:pilus assembly protein FimV
MLKLQADARFPVSEVPVPRSSDRGGAAALRARFVAVAVAAAFAAVAAPWSPQASAAGLGRLTVHSALGQALDASVEVPAVSPDEAPSLQVRLASAAAFKQANLEFNQALSQLHFDLLTGTDGGYSVHITSESAITEPYLDLLLELTWTGGHVLRQYTVLLDPPGLRQAPEIVAPATSAPAALAQPAQPAPAAPAAEAALAAPPAAAPPAPAPAPAAAQTAAAAAPVPPAPKAAPVAQTSAPAEVHVRLGDTLGKIALANKTADVSLDQMLVALLRANPNAFIKGNMNMVRAGADLAVPGAADVEGVDAGEAHRVVIAQSNDFNEYRSRLAQAVTQAPPVPEKQVQAAGQGKVTPKVAEAVPPRTGDQLKIARAEAAKAAAAKRDEEIARQRALQEEKERAAQLEKANADLKRANDLAAKAAAEKAAAEKAAAEAKAAADAKAAKAAAEKAAAAKAQAEKLAAAKVEAPPAPAPKAPLPRPAAPPPAPAPEGSLFDNLLSVPVLGGAAAVLLALLAGLNVLRRRRGATGEQFKTDEAMAANSLFGTAGGQSVDTGATSTFNSSFIPAASQLDSNEVDPVAEADVYVAYGREEQAEEILKEALRLQPDRAAVRVKLLEIYSRRGDTASFNAVAKELHERTGGVGEDWDRAAKLGKSLDPTNPLYAGATGLMEAAAAPHAPKTDLRVDQTADLAGLTPTTLAGELEADTLSHMVGDKFRLQPESHEQETAVMPETAMPFDLHPAPSAAAPASTLMQPFEATLPEAPPLPPVAPPAPAAALAAAPAPTPAFAQGPAAAPGIDFGALDFDLGPSKINFDTPTEMPVEKEEAPITTSAPVTRPLEPPTIPSLDLMFASSAASKPVPPAPPTLTGTVPIPKIDLNLPTATPPRAPEQAAIGSLEEALSRPTLVGAVGALGGDSEGPRLSSNTDQATVPLIDFDLTGADAALTGRRTETQAGSPMASQMATKLDLARGYIDLGVKDGARELLEEVMKDGTREQRQQAVELIKLVEA